MSETFHFIVSPSEISYYSLLYDFALYIVSEITFSFWATCLIVGSARGHAQS